MSKNRSEKSKQKFYVKDMVQLGFDMRKVIKREKRSEKTTRQGTCHG